MGNADAWLIRKLKSQLGRAATLTWNAVLVDQQVVDPIDRVPLLARRVQVDAQHVVDHRLERVQLRGRGGIGLRG
jgi:hypothetical protein